MTEKPFNLNVLKGAMRRFGYTKIEKESLGCVDLDPVPKNSRTLLCKDCKSPCCEGYLSVRFQHDQIILLPLSRKKINIDGIPLVRITDRLWRCEWYDPEKKRCKYYRIRPTVCRNWFCGNHKKESGNTDNTSVYCLVFDKKMINRRKNG